MRSRARDARVVGRVACAPLRPTCSRPARSFLLLLLRLPPSVCARRYVAFGELERLGGDAAKNQAAMNPINTVFDAKRLIGRKFSDPIVQADMKLWCVRAAPVAVKGVRARWLPTARALRHPFFSRAPSFPSFLAGPSRSSRARRTSR